MRLIILLTSLLLTANLVQAVTILVPSEQPTIQAGINVASEGDTVLVAAGTYSGDGNRDLTFNGVNLVLKSESGADVTTVDCEGIYEDPHIAIFLDNNEDSTSKIEGFTFINAHPHRNGLGNGALHFRSGVANVNDCIFLDNIYHGITINSGTNSVLIENSVFINNGDGIQNSRAKTVIRNCEFYDNSGGIVYGAETEIYNSIFIHNRGPGIAHYSDYNVPIILIDHCTIAFNIVGFQYAFIAPRGTENEVEIDTVIIRNSIVAYNSHGGISNQYADWISYKSENSNVFGNGEFNWPDSMYSHGDEFGNLSVTPLFCDTTIGNYYLGENSPCASGNNSSGSTIGAYGVGCGCCVGIRGNVSGDLDDQIDISDLIVIVFWIWGDGLMPCYPEHDVDGSGGDDISDLIYLVGYMFAGGPEPVQCN